MTTATTITEEELLIITDDDISETNNIEIVQEKSNNENIIEFGETKIVEDEKKETIGENTIDLNFDLGGDDTEIQVSDIFGEEKENPNPLSETKEDIESNFSFDLGEEKVEEIKTEKVISKEDEETSIVDFGIDLEKNTDTLSETKEEKIEKEKIEEENTPLFGDDSATGDDDINTILEATIIKLKNRKESIEKIKLETSSKIEELAREIKELQTDVKIHKSEIKDFDKETCKIEENIGSLETMKMK
ncbi:MAG: hypothetical protein Q9M94_05780 [Candidatus Gracilibacteria bacterium]|nr:hypothetical protein [Candidatus Gracilibacteria bacterium]MDQ7022412.1 hypothetical protein [Candidatus Gracilibacteria bacterium]